MRDSFTITQTRVKIRLPHDGVVVREAASQSVDLGLISQVESYQKTSKKVFTASLLGAQHKKGIMWRTSRKACWLCPGQGT